MSQEQPETQKAATPVQPPPMRRPGSHAVPIVAPPAEDKAPELEEVKPEGAAEKKEIAAEDKKPEAEEVAKSEEEAVVEAAAVGRDEVDGAAAVVPQQPQAAALPAQPAAAAEARSESGDSGNEDEGSISDQEPELQNQPDREGGIFAARLVMEADVNEKIR